MRGGWVDTYHYMRKAAIRQRDPRKLAEVERLYRNKAIAEMNK